MYQLEQLRKAGRIVRRALADGREVEQVEKTFRAEIRALDVDAREVEVVASDGTKDRYGDTINPDGWELGNYRKNPIFLADHSYRVDHVTGQSTGERVENGLLIVRSRFLPAGLNPLADMVLGMVEAGAIRTVSVGFRSLEHKFRYEDEKFTGIDFIRQELLEVSWVAVPANPNAVALTSAPEPVRDEALAGMEHLLYLTTAARLLAATR
jgi:HK97 family phage prohead protease